jgi:hypothetical protein
MPLDNYITKPDFSRQIKQYANTIATLSGQTNILEKFSVKSIEIDTAGANDGDALIYDLISNKFSSNVPGSLGSRVIGGLVLTYNSGLTYNVSQGTYRINSTLYGYTGGTINISSGLTSGSRFDVVFITSAATALVSAGTTAINPFIPQINVSGGELQVGIIFVIPSFTGGAGTTIIQSTGSTFEFNSAAASAGIQRQGGVGAAATGDYSFASNFQAKASGNYSSAIGYYAEATGISQTVVGQYNIPDEGYFIVGNGESSGSRSNAFRVTTGGSAYVTNKLFVSGKEIETTGASINQALIYDGTKFKPQNITGGTSSTGITSGTSSGNGVKVLFSSDTTTLSFATLSSQTPSSLIILSSPTGVILFSATTGSVGSGGVGTLQQVTDSGNTTTNGILVADLSATTVNIGTSGTIGKLITTSLTTDREFNFPDRDGQILVSGYEYIDLTTAQSATDLKIGQWYRIPVSSRTVTESLNPNNYGDIILMGVDTNKLSIDGYLLAINADYNSVGVYTDANTIAGGAITQRGVPYRNLDGSGINYVAKNIAIFNNIHWLCTSNKNNTKLLSELEDTNFFTALTKDYTSTYGYVVEADKIKYDLSTDRILSREDKRGNVIYETNSNLILDRFRFGDNNVTENFIKASNVTYFDVLNIPKNNFIFKNNTLSSFNKLFFDSLTGGDFLQTGVTVPVYISGVSINDGKFEAVNKVMAYDGSINNYNSTIEETLIVTSSTIDLRYKYLTGQIILQSGSGFNRVISSITQSSTVPYNVDVSFSILSGGVSGITFVNSDLMKTEGGISAFISGNTIDNIHFNKLYIGGIFYDTFRQININNYI